LGGASIAAGATALGTLPLPASWAGQELRLITWEGYASDDIIADFVKSTGATVSRTYISSNDEYMAKLAAGGGDYDMAVIVTSYAQQAIKQNFIEPLDIDKLPNFKALYPKFQDFPYYQHEGKIYGSPTYWGLVPITVNADVIPDRNDFDLLFDPQYKGRIAMWDDLPTLAQVARWMGFEKIWDLSDDELAAVKVKLLEQRPLVRKYWSQPGELIDLFASGEVVAAISWDYVTQELLKQGLKVRQPTYKTAMAWSDSHTIVRGTAKRDLAHAFINYMISPKAQALIAQTNLYRVTNPAAKPQMDALDPKLWGFLSMDEGGSQLPATDFWDAIPRRAKYLEVWNEVKAASAG
jgi:putative spermidine/putrescine transport system substrate-binding protein/spermidine/putrescine transport system substrate-binding protein